MGEDPSGLLALRLAIILLAAKLGGEGATRSGQPAVLGELLVGVLLGNLVHLGLPLGGIIQDPFVDMLARLGVLLLLFRVGLESTVRQMMEVGASALLVAVLGVLGPFALGWLVSSLLLPDHSVYVHAFIGATLCATSVGITARVLDDAGRSRSAEARVILGAAVIDDVLGLLILAVVAAVIAAADAGGTLEAGKLVGIVVKALVFLVGGLALGVLLSPRLFHLASRFRAPGVLLALGLAFCFVLSWAAGAMGLSPIVGAFAAGLVLEDVHFRDFTGRGEHGLEELIAPITDFLVPIFFVLMGMRTDLTVFRDPGVLLLAGALTLAAVIGKQASMLGVLQKGVDRITVGMGMVPRGEVGLIFAGLGITLTFGGERIVSESTFSAIVVMVIVTTLITPPALAWRFRQKTPG